MHHAKSRQMPFFPRTKIPIVDCKKMGEQLHNLLHKLKQLSVLPDYKIPRSFDQEFEKLLALDEIRRNLEFLSHHNELDQVAICIEANKLSLKNMNIELIYDIIALVDSGKVSIQEMKNQNSFIRKQFHYESIFNPFLLALTIFHSKNACRKTPTAIPVEERRPLYQRKMQCTHGEKCRYFHDGKLCLRNALLGACTADCLYDEKSRFAVKYNGCIDDDEYFGGYCKYMHDCVICHLSQRITSSEIYLPTCDRRNPDEEAWVKTVSEKMTLADRYDSALEYYRRHHELCENGIKNNMCGWCNPENSHFVQNYSKEFTIEFLAGIEKEEDYDHSIFYGKTKMITKEEYTSEEYKPEKKFAEMNEFYGYSNSYGTDNAPYRVLNLDFYMRHNLLIDLSTINFAITPFKGYNDKIQKLRDNVIVPGFCLPAKSAVRWFKEDKRSNTKCSRKYAILKFYKSIVDCFDLNSKIFYLENSIRSLISFLQDDDFSETSTEKQKAILESMRKRYKENKYAPRQNKVDNVLMFGQIASYVMSTNEFRDYYFQRYRNDPLPRAFLVGENIEPSGGFWDRQAEILKVEERKLELVRVASEYKLAREREEQEYRLAREREEELLKIEKTKEKPKSFATSSPRFTITKKPESFAASSSHWPALKGQGLQIQRSSYAQVAVKPPSAQNNQREDFPALKPQRKRK